MEVDLKSICEGLPSWAHYGVWIALLLWELFLSKTKIVKAGSTIELILNPLLAVWRAAKKKDEENDSHKSV